MALNNNKINMRVRLPNEHSHSNENYYTIFHCVKCGVHPKAFTVSVAKGDDSQILTKLVKVLPGEIEVVEIFGKLPCGSEIIETVFCGNCGMPGNWDTMPEDELYDMGVMIVKSENDEEYEEEEIDFDVLIHELESENIKNDNDVNNNKKTNK